MNRPETLVEWQSMISKLAGPNLRSKTIAANSQQFAEMLMEDGYSMDDVAEIMQMLVTQMAVTKMNPPGGGVWDLQGMTDTIGWMGSGRYMDDEVIEQMADNQPDDPPDNIDAAAEWDGLDHEWGETVDLD